MKINSAFLFVLTFIAAFCSLTYELILSQVLAAALGGSLLRFCTVVGLFSLTLGLGALAFGRQELTFKERLYLLFYVELFLTGLGLLGPIAIVSLDPLRSTGVLGHILEAMFYIPVVGIGFLSGYELPLLLSLCRDRRAELRILASDYVGMFAGSLMVPFVIYPRGGPFVGSVWVALLNLLAAGMVLWILRKNKLQDKLKRKEFYFVGTTLVAIGLLITQKFWLEWMSAWFIA